MIFDSCHQILLSAQPIIFNSEAAMLSRPDGTLVLVDSYSRLVDVTTDINVGVELSVFVKALW